MLVSASSATTYIESAAGVAAGGRTGLVSVVTGVLFLLALPFVALVGAIPAVATAPALIVVGVLMVGVLSEGAAGRRGAINFRNLDDAVPVVLTMLVMPLTFSITNGIGAGFVSYVLDQAGERQGTGGPSGALCRRRGLPDLLPALGAVRRPILTDRSRHHRLLPE